MRVATFIIWGSWMWSQQKTTYWILLETKEIKNDVVYQTNYQDKAQEIIRALDTAIANLMPT